MQRLVLAASAVLSPVALGVALTARPKPAPPPPSSPAASVDPSVVASLEGRVRAREAALEVRRASPERHARVGRRRPASIDAASAASSAARPA